MRKDKAVIEEATREMPENGTATRGAVAEEAAPARGGKPFFLTRKQKLEKETALGGLDPFSCQLFGPRSIYDVAMHFHKGSLREDSL